MARKDSGHSLETRLISLLAALPFALVTAALLWLAVNQELAFMGRFLGSGFFWGCLGIFLLAAFALPTLFPHWLGMIWRGFIRLYHYWL
ncbi:hypothetical protein GCM10009425_20170 [Pseudomonas asuensis]|jgi:hypothetical protein|uniref:DUF4175 domain-containing protein n=1 Tax=Pseudomonas asuensis TaxID=1825787 RepID=A0ABQ2GS11_9PSED|nr:hypothetical protein [Pseudomonas asuensis]GGM08894.1 hypothetical protein GCM10009425_20170 [Pseudomonas asuensis]